MPQTINELGQRVKAKYPGQYDDMPDDEIGRRVKAKYPGQYDDFSDVSSAAVSAQQQQAFANRNQTPTPIPQDLQSSRPAEDPQMQKLRELGMGASPLDIPDRIVGVGQTLGQWATGAYQAGRNALGMTPQTYTSNGVTTATPQSLEAKNPNQAIGQKVGELSAMTMMPGPLPVQTAVGALAGGLGNPEHPTQGAIMGGAMPLAMKTVGEIIGPRLDPQVQKAKEVRQMENKLLGGPNRGSREARKIAYQTAPQLVEQDPALVKLKGLRADQHIFDKFQEAKAMMDAAEQSIPKNQMIQKSPLIQSLDDEIEQLQIAAQPQVVPGQPSPLGHLGAATPEQVIPQTISGRPEVVSLLGEWRNRINKLPDSIPFSDVRQLRQQLDRAIQDTGGWKETAASADTLKMNVLRGIANTLRGELRGISKPLDEANAAYSLAHDTLLASGIDADLGRRLSNVTQMPSLAKRAIPAVLKYGGAGTAAYGGKKIYDLLRDLKGPPQ